MIYHYESSNLYFHYVCPHPPPPSVIFLTAVLLSRNWNVWDVKLILFCTFFNSCVFHWNNVMLNVLSKTEKFLSFWWTDFTNYLYLLGLKFKFLLCVTSEKTPSSFSANVSPGQSWRKIPGGFISGGEIVVQNIFRFR